MFPTEPRTRHLVEMCDAAEIHGQTSYVDGGSSAADDSPVRGFSTVSVYILVCLQLGVGACLMDAV